MPEHVLETRQAGKQFFRKGRESATYFDAVAPLDFALRSGELVCLTGRSGSGKSTLLNMLSGLLAPTTGSVLCDGTDLYALSDAELSKLRNEQIGVIPQGQSALHNLTVIQNVTLPYTMYRDAGDIEEQALALLESLDIRGLADSYPSELSGGEMRRMAIARALICNPRFILADEPTGDLDDENTAAVLSLLRNRAREGAGVLLVTHEQLAPSYADRHIRMTAGTLEQQ